MRRRREALREVEDVVDVAAAERVDRLRVVADDGDAAAVGLQAQQDARLQRVRVLVLVDQHVVEARADLGGERRVGHERPTTAAGRRSRATLLRLLARRRRRGTARASCGSQSTHHGNGRAARSRSGSLRVDAVRVDGEAGVLAREALRVSRQPEPLARRTSIRSAASPRSRTLKPGSRPSRRRTRGAAGCRRRGRCRRPRQPHAAATRRPAAPPRPPRRPRAARGASSRVPRGA